MAAAMDRGVLAGAVLVGTLSGAALAGAGIGFADVPDDRHLLTR